MSEVDLVQVELELGYILVCLLLFGYISECNVDLGILVGLGGKLFLVIVVKSDMVLVDFSMIVLDYLKSKECNINIGQQDFFCFWQLNIIIILVDNMVYFYKGYVDFVEFQVDLQIGIFLVRVEMLNLKQVLFLGQFMKVKLFLDVCEGVIVVLYKVVIIEKGGVYIYVMCRDFMVEKWFIELGFEFGNKFVVERGLGVGEEVVVEGYYKLILGMKVRVILFQLLVEKKEIE